MPHFGSRGCSSSSETDAADVQEDHKVYLWPIKQKKDNLNTRDFGHEIQELHFKLEHNQHFNADHSMINNICGCLLFNLVSDKEII